jgi:hypothetical protein
MVQNSWGLGMKLRAYVAIGVTAILAVACAGNVNRLTYTEHTHFYSPQLVQYVTNKGYFPVTMYGTSFGADGNGEIAKNLRLPGNYQQVPFKDVSGQPSDDPGRLVLLMDANGIVDGDKLCGDPGKLASTAQQSEKLQVQASFCYQDEMVSHSVLTTLRPKTAGDPGFQHAMRHAKLKSKLLLQQIPQM